MDLKKIIKEYSKGFNENISEESFCSLVLFQLSQNNYFSKNYDNFELIMKNKEIRVLALPVKNKESHSDISLTVIKPTNNDNSNDFFWESKKERNERNKENNKRKEQTKNSDDPYDYYNSFIPVNKSFDDSDIYINKRRLNNINFFYNTLEKSNNIEEVISSFQNQNNYFIQDIKQTLLPFSKRDIGLNNFINLIDNIFVYKNENGIYKIENRKREIGYTLSRDLFECSSLSWLSKSKDDNYTKNVFERERLSSVKKLFVDKNTMEVPDEILDIFNNDDVNNWKAVELFEGDKSKYNNELFNIVFDKDKDVDKINKIINYFFKDLKNNAIKNKNLDFFKQSESLISESYSYVSAVVDKIKKDYPFLSENHRKNINSIDSYYFENKQEYGKHPQYDFLNKNKINIYENNNDKNANGLSCVNKDFFTRSEEEGENVLVVANNGFENIGFGSLYQHDNVYRISIVNIANHYRGQKLMKEIYKKFADEAVKNNMPIETTLYTELGEKRLPQVKKEILEERKDLLWLDTTIHEQQNDLEKILSEINHVVLRKISFDRSISLREIREIYDTTKNFLNKDNIDYFDYKDKREIKENFIELFEAKYDNALKQKQKQENKRTRRNKM